MRMALPLRAAADAIRTLRSQKALALTLAAVIAIAVGAATANFSAASRFLLEELPYRNPDELVIVAESHAELPVRNVRIPTYLALKERATSLEDACAFSARTATVTEPGPPHRAGSVKVCASFFDLLGHAPLIGRTFVPGDEGRGKGNVIVVSEDYWRDQLDGRGSVIGESIIVNEQALTIVGVMPSDFEFPTSRSLFRFASIPPVAFWRPLDDTDYPPVSRQISNFNHNMIGRLVDGASATQLETEYRTIAAQLHAQYPDGRYDETGIDASYLAYELQGKYATSFWAFGAAILAFCLIAALNVATLLLMQGVARRREFATRLALGATHARILAQLAAEMLLVLLARIIHEGAASGWSRSATAVSDRFSARSKA